MGEIETFTNQPYLNLETFRKNGAGVKTPVWFVQDGSTLFIRTIANSGKVKRVRGTGRVNIAPCKADGTLLGDWLPAKAREIKDPATMQHIDKLLDHKYGLVKKLFGLAVAMRGSQYTILEVKTGIKS